MKKTFAKILKEMDENPSDVIKLDVPLFIRLIELAREEINNDVDLHKIAENIIRISSSKVASMADYEEIIQGIGKKENENV